MPTPTIENGVETYLGDGLHVSFDGYQICLRANGERVYLEPQVWYSLIEWVKRFNRTDFPIGTTQGDVDG